MKVSVRQLLAVVLVSVAATSSFAALKFDADVPANIQTQMVEDLVFMNQITGAGQTPFHKEIFTTLDGKSYQTFFESRIFSVGVDACGGGAAVACVQPFFDPNKMWLTKNFINFSHPQIARLMVVYHEARHSETKNGNWMHANCPRPFLDENGKDMVSIWTGAKLAGEAACDSKYQGSYGSSTIMLKNISKFCSNCNDKVKMDADIYSTDQLGRISKPAVKQQMLADFAN